MGRRDKIGAPEALLIPHSLHPRCLPYPNDPSRSGALERVLAACECQALKGGVLELSAPRFRRSGWAGWTEVDLDRAHRVPAVLRPVAPPKMAL